MAENVEEFTDSNFDEKVLKGDNLTVVDFWADWCAPCKMIAPTIEELATKFNGKVSMGKLNVDENNKTATKYGIRSIPTLLFFKDGSIVNQVVGVRSKDELEEVITQNM
ncbi:MAG TPA: thioredoxin [Nitrospinota bacterium]|nr:thioredoxin [Nitrospinota bacterium]|tara:strand:- start:7319 stop:7645 length:327 start_codon:yes stop_codon:yes gene_type:complete